MLFLQNGIQSLAIDLSAVDSPDGFFGFMSPAFSYEPFASDCPDSEKFHDPIVIATLLQNAISSSAPSAYLAFLRSMMSHMVADFIGFNPLGGYLAQVTTSVNWVTMWTKMQTIDAFFVLQNGMQNVSIPFHARDNLVMLSNDMKKFANVSFSADVLLQCGNGEIGENASAFD